MDFVLKSHGLDLFKEDGWLGSDGMHRIEVRRVEGGGVTFRIDE